MSTFQVISLDTVIFSGKQNRLDEGLNPTIDGAKAILETFYHAFNTRDLELFARVWFNHPHIQLNNPLGGIMRGAEEITTLYKKVFQGHVMVQVEFHDVILYTSTDYAVFAGRERGIYRIDQKEHPLPIPLFLR